MFIQNTLIDNSEGFMLSEYLREMLGKEEYRRLRIATGYWDLAGMKLLQKELEAYFERGGILDLLIGQEPQLRSYQMRSDLTKEEKFPDFYIQKDIEKLSDDYQPLVKLLLEHTNPDDESQSQVKIRVYGQDGEEQRFLHAKCYIFSGYGVAHGIIGSSNFTEKGLQGNAELNYLETNPRIVDGAITEYGKSHIAWFNEMWEQSVPWTGRFIKDTLPRYILIILFASAVPVTLKHFMDSCTSSSIIICLVSVICTVISSILIGFRKSERTAVFNYVKAKLAKNK